MRPYLFDEDSDNDLLLGTPFPLLSGAKVQTLTQAPLLVLGTQFSLLYSYKSTHTDADAAASRLSTEAADSA